MIDLSNKKITDVDVRTDEKSRISHIRFHLGNIIWAMPNRFTDEITNADRADFIGLTIEQAENLLNSKLSLATN